MLQALAAVADVLRQWEFVQQYGSWVEAHRERLPAEVVDWWQQAQQVRCAEMSPLRGRV